MLERSKCLPIHGAVTTAKDT